VAAKAHGPPLWQLRRYSHPPLFLCQSTLAFCVALEKLPHPLAPKRRAKPQGGWVGETCISGAPLAARVLWQGQGITLALRTSAASSHCGRTCASPKRWLAARVALLLEHLFVPKRVGRHCSSSSRIGPPGPIGWWARSGFVWLAGSW
jgi:hypothetical protein